MSPPRPLTDVPCSTEWPALLLPLRLEARRIDNDVCIRVFPDQPFVDAHRKELTQEEVAAASALVASVRGADLTTARGQWGELARRYGPGRAAWILESLLPEAAEPATSDDQQFVPRMSLLPDRFLFLMYGTAALAYHESGEDVRADLPLLPLPTTDRSDAPPTDGLFDEQSKWVTDFESARTAGLAIKIPLRTEHVADPALRFTHIVVVGLRTPREDDEAPPFVQLVRNHRFTDGFEILPYGTPTNNTSQDSAGHSESEERLLASFDYEVLSPVSGVSDQPCPANQPGTPRRYQSTPSGRVPLNSGRCSTSQRYRTTSPRLCGSSNARSVRR